MILHQAVANSGMELDSDWSLSGLAEYYSGDFHGGSRSVFLQGSRILGVAATSVCSQKFRVVKTLSYTLEFWYRTPAGTGTMPDMVVTMGNLGNILPVGDLAGLSAPDWTKKTYTGWSYSTDPDVYLMFQVPAPGGGASGSAQFLVDDVVLTTPLEGAIEPENGPGPIEFARSIFDAISGTLVKETQAQRDWWHRVRDAKDLDDLGRTELSWLWGPSRPRRPEEEP